MATKNGNGSDLAANLAEMAQDATGMKERMLSEVSEKIESMRPGVEQVNAAFEELIAFRDSLTGAPARRRSGRTGSGSTRTPGSSGGTRAVNRPQEFLDFLAQNPGAGIPDVSKALGGVSNNYLYKVRETLVDQGLVRKDDKRLFLTEEGITRVSEGIQIAEGAAA
jgi:hypothetical protein